jgi:protein CpxP
MRDQMKKDREAADAELKKVLTEEQYKTYKANEEKRMKEWQQSGQSHQGGNRSGGFPRN